MNTENLPSSNNRISLGKLTITLLVTALCSQTLLMGIVLFATAAFANFMNTSGRDTEKSNILGIASIIIIIAGPLLLGLYFRPGWRGTLGGLVGSIIMAGFGLITFVAGSPNVNSDLFIVLLMALGFSFGILVILAFSNKIKSAMDWLGFGLAIVVGPIISGIIFGIGRLSGFYFWSLPILWTWLSAVFFPDLLSGRIERRGVLIWMAFMILSSLLIISGLKFWQ